MIPIFLKLFQKTEEEGTLSNSLYDASISLIPHQTKTLQKGKFQANNADEHGYKNPQQNILAGTSLVVQWIRLRAPNAGGLGSIPGQGTRSHMHADRKSVV